ncbi:LysE family translocator [Ciceribacter sp. L1K22]|uniref:LysE family translocator n=1 Tax=Ciceribacter sp. L1K22 TaxID=2820275 RepID=UPI001ABDD8CB|nr:LysE family translocator [Ciceribacter sp. L1K22]MBO3762576.1 LysE family translocator [Ciceribacter sp. L1K22]
MMTFVFAVTPGPAMVYTANQAITEGRSAGLRAALGIHLASYFHIILASTGLALLLQNSPELFFGMKALGCAYLVGLGLITLIRRPDEQAYSGALDVRRNWLSNAFMVEVLNPKSALFFLSFLPQFTEVGGRFSVPFQILIYGTFANTVFSLSEVSVVLFAERLYLKIQRSPSMSTMVQRISGTILILLGSHLAFAPF